MNLQVVSLVYFHSFVFQLLNHEIKVAAIDMIDDDWLGRKWIIFKQFGHRRLFSGIANRNVRKTSRLALLSLWMKLMTIFDQGQSMDKSQIIPSGFVNCNWIKSITILKLLGVINHSDSTMLFKLNFANWVVRFFFQSIRRVMFN